jgi:hypothetical protein
MVMTVFKLSEPPPDVSTDVAVWRCEGCGCVHMRAGGVLLTFTPREYTDFTERVADCYWSRRYATCPRRKRLVIHPRHGVKNDSTPQGSS